ncbi:lipopolysaccharide biosynthesis protein [Methylorubrum sp. SB2]|uniref:lipopolysaccharide biosynthesis protein n=1 Tax=Methylorubrum subtropicum TaxID=3138812 RepID=UPI00313E09E4
MSADLDCAELPRSAALRGVRRRIGLSFLGHPSAYAVGVCVVSLLSMATTLIVPRLLDPVAFGAFALLGTLFQYAARADLGLSQLADRDLACGAPDAAARGVELLRASWALGLGAILILTPLAVAGAVLSGRFAPGDAALAVVAGVLGMVAHAPTSIYRAASQHWDFALLALLQQAGLTAPRLAGLLLAGVTGCFAALTLWSGLLALAFAQPRHALAWRPAVVLPMVRAALPLFVFNTLWLVTTTANRWVAALLSPPDRLGLFAFGANLALVGLAIVGTVAQVRYPKLLRAMADAPEGRSALLAGEIQRAGLTLAAVALAAIPLTAPVIALLFPGYEGAAGTTVWLALACLPLGTAAWIVPMALVLTASPLREALRIFGPSLALLTVGMAAGDALAGIAGQGAACAGAGLVLFAGLIGLFRRADILSPQAARRAVLTQTTLLAALALTVWEVTP